MSKAGMWAKMAAVGLLCGVGGPMLMYYTVPAEGEVVKRFNPELQKHNMDNKDRRQREYEDFVGKLKEYSKSDKPIWVVAAEEEAKAKELLQQKAEEEKSLADRIRAEMRAEAQGK